MTSCPRPLDLSKYALPQKVNLADMKNPCDYIYLKVFMGFY